MIPPIRMQLGVEDRLGDSLESHQSIVVWLLVPSHVRFQRIQFFENPPDTRSLIISDLPLVHMHLYPHHSLEHCLQVRPAALFTVVDQFIHREVKMERTRDLISRILDFRAMFLSFQMIPSLVRAVVVWAILDRISGFEPSSVIKAPRYLNLFTVSSF